MCTSSSLEMCAYRDYNELCVMLSNAKASIRASIWRYMQEVMQRPGDEWDRYTVARHNPALNESTQRALSVLTKHSNKQWVARVNLVLVNSIEALFVEFIRSRAVPLVFVPWGSAHIDRRLSLESYHRYVRAYVSLSVTDVIGCARSAAGLELRTACFVGYRGGFVPHSEATAILVAVASMAHGRLGAGSPGLVLDTDCLWSVCRHLFAPGAPGWPPRVENTGALLA